MSSEEEIVHRLQNRFPFLEDRIYVQRAKRVFTMPLKTGEFEQVVRFAHDEMGLTHAHQVIGTDDGAELGLIYLVSGDDHIIVALRESVTKQNPLVNSVSDLYPSIVLHERELVDLFGVHVIGLPDGPNYPLPDGWPEGSYPLRKEWNPKYFNQETMTYEPPQPKETEDERQE